MRDELLGSRIGSNHWSDALRRVECLKNRLLHKYLRNSISTHEAWINERSDLSHPHVFGSFLCAKKLGIRRGKLDTSLIIRDILLGYIPTSPNATCHDSITRYTKTSIHFLVDEVHCTSKNKHVSFTKDLLHNHKNKLTTYPKSFYFTLNHHAEASTATHKYSEVIRSELHITDAHNSPSFDIKTPLKGCHSMLGLES